jgi:hypothetical protein
LSRSTHEWQVSGKQSKPHFGSTRPTAVARDRRLLGELKVITADLVRPAVEKIRAHLGLEPQPPPNSPTRELVPHHAG